MSAKKRLQLFPSLERLLGSQKERELEIKILSRENYDKILLIIPLYQLYVR